MKESTFDSLIHQIDYIKKKIASKKVGDLTCRKGNHKISVKIVESNEVCDQLWIPIETTNINKHHLVTKLK